MRDSRRAHPDRVRALALPLHREAAYPRTMDGSGAAVTWLVDGSVKLTARIKGRATR